MTPTPPNMRSLPPDALPLNAPSPLAELRPPSQPSPHHPQPRPISPPPDIPPDAATTHMATTVSSSPSVSNQTSLRHNCIAPAQRPNTPNGVQDEPPSKRRRTSSELPLASPLMLPASVQNSDLPAPILRPSQVAPLANAQPNAALPTAPENRPPRGEDAWSHAQAPPRAAHESPTHTANDSTTDHPSPNNASASTFRVTSEMVASEESRPPAPVQLITSTATVSAHTKDTRRIWNRRSLERSGISSNALSALESFMKNVPPIPIQPDHNRKQTRNMRGWIMQLEKPSCDSLWDKLMDVLRTDLSPQRACGRHWDHDVCRFILGHVVSENRSSQTRQAMNNAIKRELICPSESGNSTRGKTFRDLFREKCQKAEVKLNPLEDGAYPKRSSHPTFSARHASVPPSDVPSRFASEFEDPSGAHPFPLSSRRATEVRISESELKKLREGCPYRDEWGQTAWWRLESDEDVKLLPELLVDHSLFELRNLLIDFRWMRRMFRCVDFSQGMYQAPARAYDVMLKYAESTRSHLPSADVESFRLVRNAIMVILPVLFKHKARPTDQGFHAHLATQLTGRLVSLKRKFPAIACLIQSIELHAPKPWLKPLTRCFRQPRTDIALAVPSEGIFIPHQLVLSDDGKFLVTTNASMREPRNKMKLEPAPGPAGIHGNGKKSSGSQFHSGPRKTISITVWDVCSGKRVAEVPNIHSHVSHVAIAKDNNCIIGETYDGLYFWHFDKRETWKVSMFCKGNPRVGGLSSIKPTATPELVLTTHKREEKSVIVLWNTQTGAQEKVYDAVKSEPNCLDIYSRRQYFASGHDNGFIHLWNWKDDRPILTFKNEGCERGAQNGVSLSDANNQKDSNQASARTISISFFERENDLSLASVSSERTAGGQEYIRIWVLPPKKFLDGSSQAFVSCKRAAVWKCGLVRQVFCSVDGNLFTGGDDGVARMWEREENDRWKEYTIEQDSNEDSKMSSTFICCGKKTKLIATYVTKSPYVVVWDTRNKELRRTIMTRTGVYKPYIPIEPHSVDVADMNQYQVLPDKGTGEFWAKFGEGGSSGQGGSKHQQGSKKLWDNPELFFRQQTRDSNSVIRPGQLQPWLQLKLERGDMQGLHVCFDQPVTFGVTGLFVNAPNSVGDIAGGGSEDGKRDGRDVLQRRGMAIKLEDKRTELFEVEGGVRVGQAASGVEVTEVKNVGENAGSKATVNAAPASANEKEGAGQVKEVANAAAAAGDVSSVT